MVAWNKNYEFGPYNDNADKSDSIGGFLCWDWSNIFADALNKLHPKCVSFEQGIAMAPAKITTDKQGFSKRVTPVHWYLKVYACKRNDNEYRVNFDDGFFDGSNTSHPGAFPPEDSDYKESILKENATPPTYAPFKAAVARFDRI